MIIDIIRKHFLNLLDRVIKGNPEYLISDGIKPTD
jgi:hypothetical protein